MSETNEDKNLEIVRVKNLLTLARTAMPGAKEGDKQERDFALAATQALELLVSVVEQHEDGIKNAGVVASSIGTALRRDIEKQDDTLKAHGRTLKVLEKRMNRADDRTIGARVSRHAVIAAKWMRRGCAAVWKFIKEHSAPVVITTVCTAAGTLIAMWLWAAA